MRRILKILKSWKFWLKLLIVAAAGFVFAVSLFFFYLLFIVPVQDTGGKFTRENVLINLNGESRVFYSDGVSVLGSFFDTNHRLYVPYDSIPQTLVDAIVSAEDSRFWEHRGFDMSGFMRAMFNNVKKRSFRQGGSTLSQQTVKNVFGREEKSIKAKWTELTDAMRLEKHFTKKDILEFYLNQFQVYGSGRGAAIAAIYFFNKPLSELSLEECAFIAGTVKGPYNYDPRVQKTPERAQTALEKGQARTKYVLKRMLENHYINQSVYDAAKIPVLNYGEFRFNTSSILDKVDRELSDDFYTEIFTGFGIEDWRRAQIKIVTTLDAGLQGKAESSVKENLNTLQNKIGADTASPLQGALVALKNGMVVAAQSGQNNVGYDRAFIAERQFGSSWKPLLFALALKLGWNPLDELENEYNLFTYGTTTYFPRPDHLDKSPQASMAWAAVRSENIASVWLLEHLLDKLPTEEIRALAEKNVIDTSITSGVKNEIALEKAKMELTNDWLLDGRFEAARALQALRYSYGRKETEKQKNFPERVKLLQHSYEYYSSVEAYDFDELFPHFTFADFKEVQNSVEQNRANPLQPGDVFLSPELRKKIAMAEFAAFVKSIGINRNLQEVMSMPLGVNEATIAEMANAYQSILSGKLYKCKDKKPAEPCIIKEIWSSGNRLIFRNEVDSSEVLPSSVVLPMQAMLRAVFKYGTAASAYSKISIPYSGVKYPFPAMGKTGTTNENRTAAFCGAMPLDTLLTICSYIGFDDNNKLKGKSRSLAGASGALPQWASFAEAALAANKSEKILGENIDYINAISHNEVLLPNMPSSIEVDRKGGLPVKADSAGVGVALFPNF
ncbi:MAG: penicillin-binding protein [Fibromonadaceae bacterium]|jgi:membrane peptidoglycan carboxypeptidase|nr:penicillin-binding protein [Fibromonadaceae bacterium]